MGTAKRVTTPTEVAENLSEMVNHPLHYGGDTLYEVIKVLEAWLTPDEFVGWLKGTIIKYQARAGKKGAPLRDCEKAAWYATYLAEYMNRKPK
jgi:hypothetical protein